MNYTAWTGGEWYCDDTYFYQDVGGDGSFESMGPLACYYDSCGGGDGGDDNSTARRLEVAAEVANFGLLRDHGDNGGDRRRLEQMNTSTDDEAAMHGLSVVYVDPLSCCFFDHRLLPGVNTASRSGPPVYKWAAGVRT